MEIMSATLILLELALFESITSINNAIVKAGILHGMQPRA
jgi:hypothetical protein